MRELAEAKDKLERGMRDGDDAALGAALRSLASLKAAPRRARLPARRGGARGGALAELERERAEALPVLESAIASGAADAAAAPTAPRPTDALRAAIHRFKGKVRGATVREHLEVAERLVRLRKALEARDRAAARDALDPGQAAAAVTASPPVARRRRARLLSASEGELEVDGPRAGRSARARAADEVEAAAMLLDNASSSSCCATRSSSTAVASAFWPDSARRGKHRAA